MRTTRRLSGRPRLPPPLDAIGLSRRGVRSPRGRIHSGWQLRVIRDREAGRWPSVPAQCVERSRDDGRPVLARGSTGQPNWRLVPRVQADPMRTTRFRSASAPACPLDAIGLSRRGVRSPRGRIHSGWQLRVIRDREAGRWPSVPAQCVERSRDDGRPARTRFHWPWRLVHRVQSHPEILLSFSGTRELPTLCAQELLPFHDGR